MADPGFKIYNKFYPLVLLQDWNWGDFTLANKMTGVNADDLFGEKADSMLLQQALIAVAVSHTQRIDHEKLIDFVYKLKPSEVEEIGFEVTIEDDGEGDASPPEESVEAENSNTSSESSSISTPETPESETPEASGPLGSDTGSQE